jgi:hypothetical protein
MSVDCQAGRRHADRTAGTAVPPGPVKTGAAAATLVVGTYDGANVVRASIFSAYVELLNCFRSSSPPSHVPPGRPAAPRRLRPHPRLRRRWRERLLRYWARPPFALERLIPPPRFHRHPYRCHGDLVTNARLRVQVIYLGGDDREAALGRLRETIDSDSPPVAPLVEPPKNGACSAYSLARSAGIVKSTRTSRSAGVRQLLRAELRAGRSRHRVCGL